MLKDIFGLGPTETENGKSCGISRDIGRHRCALDVRFGIAENREPMVCLVRITWVRGIRRRVSWQDGHCREPISHEPTALADGAGACSPGRRGKGEVISIM
jgi:hypothetical protein